MAEKLNSYKPKAKKTVAKDTSAKKTVAKDTSAKKATVERKKRKAKKKAVRKSTSAKATKLKGRSQEPQASTPPSPRKKKGGRPATYGKAEAGDRRREAAAKYQRAAASASRDIRTEEWPGMLQGINWERRLAGKTDLRFFCETYLPGTFSKGWSQDQLRCLKKAEEVWMEGGMFALAMPRAGGKTAICRGSIIWGTAHAHRRFPYFVGSTHPMAIQTLDAVKTLWYRTPALRQDFPEVAWAIYKLENRFHFARAQTFGGESTFAEWGTDSVMFPSCLLPQEDAEAYLRHDEEALSYVEDLEMFLPAQAGILLATAGIDGSIRGEADVHPILLTQPRPDLILLDDIQKDQKAESPAACEKLIRLVDGAVSGLAGPGEHIAGLMPCTVIREGDVADTYLDPMMKPDWQGERCRMVLSWPPGITDHEITLDTEEGKLWTRYEELRRQSLREFGSIRLATAFYAENREVMDGGFTVSWEERFTSKGKNRELSAQQHAMNLRMKSPETFPAEYQNMGRRELLGDVMITAEALAEKTVAIPQDHLPHGTKVVSSFVDVQNECLFYGTLAVDQDFTGVFVDYGTFPSRRTRYFTKAQAEGWGLLTSLFFQAYPEQKEMAVRSSTGKPVAPLEAKIYHALSVFVPQLLAKNYTRTDEHQTVLRTQRLGIDTRWGQASDAIKRYIRESGLREVVPCYGQAFPPTNKQLEEYQRTGQYKSWLFEDQLHPHVKEVKWVVRQNPDGMFYLQMDVSRLKDFLFSRLSSPPGSPGSLSLFQGSPEDHEMFASHLCRSEYPEPVTARGLEKNQWKERDGRPDNDFLDVGVGCCALASWLGASTKTVGDKPVKKITRKLSDMARNRRKGGRQ